MNKIRNITILFSIFFLFSCATTQVVIETFDTSKTYMNSYDESWKKLVRFFSTNQIGIGTLEKDSGIITVNNQNLTSGLVSEYCAVTVPFLYALSGGQAFGSATLVEDGDFITANVNIQFNATFSSCDLYGRCTYITDSCPSNGSFEKALLTALE